MAKALTKKRKGYRTIHIQNAAWQWKVGKSYVTFYDPNGKRSQAFCQTVSGLNCWDRAKWKGYDQITPAMVRKWILTNMVTTL